MALTASAIGFEGYEKRLEIAFSTASNSLNSSQEGGLRSLTRFQIDSFLKPAECTIVSALSNSFLDSYVLSESSLFIYSYKIVIKTCGTTKLLFSIPVILELASQLSLKVKSVRYTRGTFIFSNAQSFPHRSFVEEVAMLNSYFGDLCSAINAYVMYSSSMSQKWHVYSAYNGDVDNSLLTLEMCMTGLNKENASVFYKNSDSSSLKMTEESGICKILPGSEICDFEFDPCGYSMNSIQGPAISTIHVTPEDGFSYASFEAMGYDLDAGGLRQLIEKVLSCFRPREFSLAVHSAVWWEQPSEIGLEIMGYLPGKPCYQDLEGGGSIVYQTFNSGNASWTKSVVKKAEKPHAVDQ